MILKRVFHFLIYTNWLIALAALSQCFLTYLLLGMKPNYFIIGIEAFSTLLLYNFSLLLAKPKNPQNSIYERTRWVFSNMNIFYINSGLSLVLVCYCLWNIQMTSIIFLIFIGLCSVSYTIPIVKYHDKRIGFRNIPYAKLFHIASIWTLSSVVFPVVELSSQGFEFRFGTILFMCLMKFVLLLICTLPFDIRDTKQDRQYGLKTLSTRFGEKLSQKITYFLLVLHVVFVWSSPFSFYIKWSFLFSDLTLLLLLVFFVFRKNANYHKVYLLDFYLVLQMPIIFIAHLILQRL